MANFDVIVVGAGCAGPAAAKKASELGLKTLLLEKAAIPGQKNISGTCLNAAALVDSDLHYLMDGPVEREIREMRTYHIAPHRTTIVDIIESDGFVQGVITDRGDKQFARVILYVTVNVHLGEETVDRRFDRQRL